MAPPRAARAPNPRPGERGQVKSQPHHLRWFGDPNPEKLTATMVRDMEKDPQVLAGVVIRELAILGKPGDFHYEAENPEDAEELALGDRMVDFLRYVWNHLDPDPNRILRDILSARRFGFSVHEIVWASTKNAEGEPVLRTLDHPEYPGFVWIERLKFLPPETLESNGFSTDEFGNLRAVHQNLSRLRHHPNDAPNRVVYAPDSPTRRMRITWDGTEVMLGTPTSRLIVYTANPKHRGDYYGVSDHKAAYNHWYSKQFAVEGRNVLLERLAGNVVGKYGSANSQSALNDALGNLAIGGVITVPMDSDVGLLQGADQQVNAFHESVRYDDIQILRAYLVPHETVGGTDSETGSFARSLSHFESFLMTLAQIQTELEEVIEEQFIRPLVLANFGEVKRLPSFDFPDPADKDLERVARIFALAVDKGFADPKVDAKWLREELELPPPPEGHQFERPTQNQAPPMQPGGGNTPTNALPTLSRASVAAAARARESPPVAFEGVDHKPANAQTVDQYERELLSTITRVLTSIRDTILDAPPQNMEDADRIVIPAQKIEDALNEVALAVLERVRQDWARKFRDLDKPHVANQLLTATSTPPTARDGGAKRVLRRVFRLAAQEPRTDQLDEALRSFVAWSAALNNAIATEQAASLQQRLRMRVIQGYAGGLAVREIALSIADEFATYTGSQLETVARTTVMDYYNSARNTAIDAAGDYVAGVKFSPLLDADTTPFCRDLVGRSISKQDPLFEKMRNPPYFFNCRTSVVPVLTSENHEFDTDWQEWYEAHRGVEGGAFVYGGSR